MPITMHGHWRLRVTGAFGQGNNRFVISGASSGNGTFALNVGTVVDVNGLPDWSLDAQFEDPENPGTWISIEIRIQEQDQTRATLSTTILSFHTVTGDNGDILVPRGDVWEGVFLGPMMDIPWRPWAVRESDLFQLPDGVFDVSLGTCLMGVRVRNLWGRTISGAVHIITQASRADLASSGIQVIDEFDMGPVGQGTVFNQPFHPDLEPGATVTSWFKLDIRNANPGKYDVEFFTYNRGWVTRDPDSPQRRATRKIFVTRSDVDQQTGELVNTTPEGELRLFLRELVIDAQGARRARHRKPTRRPPSDAPSLDELRRLLKGLLAGERVDPCLLRRLWECMCACEGGDGGRGDGRGNGGRKIGNDRFFFDPFYAFPARLRYRVTPAVPFAGQFGPIPFDDPWWKLALLILAFLLLLAGLFSQATDNAYNEDKLVIGELTSWQQNDIDAAVALLNGSRSIPAPLKQVLDAQSGELGINPVEQLDGILQLASPIMTRAEVEEILMGTSLNDPLRKVFKSGARTGLSHGLMIGSSPWNEPRDDDGTVFSIGQLRIGNDPDFEELVANKGDSGSIWVHTQSLRPIALNHSGNPEANTASASYLEDIAAWLGVSFP
jgi:hypothetical protein